MTSGGATSKQFLGMIPDSIPLGFYECPHPYKRVLDPETMAWCASTGRFIFLKDTCCDLAQIRAKLAVGGRVSSSTTPTPRRCSDRCGLAAGAAGPLGIAA